MTNAWLLHNLLIPSLYEILQKSSRKNYASAGILEKELLASGPCFTRPGTPDSGSSLLGLSRKGKTCILAKLRTTDIVIRSHPREGKTLSFGQINTIFTVFRFPSLLVMQYLY